jgi:hypothetical protein
MTRAGRQGWRTEVCRDRTSSQTDRRQRGGRRTQCEAPISLRGRGDCKGERGVPLYPFTCPKVTCRHEHTVNGTHLPSCIFPSPRPSPLGRGDRSCSQGVPPPLRSGTEPVDPDEAPGGCPARYISAVGKGTKRCGLPHQIVRNFEIGVRIVFVLHFFAQRAV